MYEVFVPEIIRILLQKVQALISEFICILKLLDRMLDIETCAFSGITCPMSLKLS